MRQFSGLVGRFILHNAGNALGCPGPHISRMTNDSKYVIWELIVWRNKIIGEGPLDSGSVWAWWMEVRTDLEGPRPEPAPNPPDTPKGEQQRKTNRRLRRNLILRLAQAGAEHSMFAAIGTLPPTRDVSTSNNSLKPAESACACRLPPLDLEIRFMMKGNEVFEAREEILDEARRDGEARPSEGPAAARPTVLQFIGKGLTTDDLIDAHFRTPDERQRQIEAEPLPPTTYDVLAEAAAEVPDQLAWNFFETNETQTYREVVDRVNRLAGSLSRIGIAKGTHVGVMLPNRAAFPLTWLALGRLGAVMIPINTGYTGRELDYVLNDGDAEYLVIDGDCLAALEAMNERPAHLTDGRIIVHGAAAGGGEAHAFDDLVAGGDPDFIPAQTAGPDDLMNIQYTSGTTGFPKGCMLPHCYWTGTGKVAARRDGIVMKNIFANQPFYYMDPQWMTLLAAYQRGTLHVVLRPSGSRFMERARRFGIHFCIFPEAVYKQPPRDDDGDNAIRRANIYGIRPSIHADLQARFNLVAREAFGMTEVGTTLFVPIEEAGTVGKGTCGRPAAFRRCRIVDDEGRDVPQGEIGELVVAGFNIFRGYYKKPEATAEAFFGEWFRTGDLFRQDEQGYYYIVGRKKDMIRRSGENISAREVESVLLEMPEIREAAVIGVKDPDRGEEVKALVILAPGVKAETVPPERILEHARRRLARFKVPRYIAYRESFPLTPSMKIRKGALREEAPDLRIGAYDAVDGIWR